MCISGTRPNCDDGNPCTVDNCVDDVIYDAGTGYGEGHCQHADICSGCTTAADCDDSNDCTVDTCNGGSCMNTNIPGCCNTVADCDDSEVCTTDSCTAHACANVPISNCCHVNADCDDSNACTDDLCTAGHTCSNTARVGCCLVNADCNDLNNCTSEICNTTSHVCQTTWTGTPGVNCCNVSAECDDGLDCNGWELCTPVPAPGTCTNPPDVVCTDGYNCTTDVCDDTRTWNATPPDFGVCTHASTTLYDTCATAGAMTASGSGDSRDWAASGDTHCSSNDYAPACTSSGLDNVHTLTVPGDGATNHQLYAYHGIAVSPTMDPTVFMYSNGVCGSGNQWACNATGVGGCYIGGHAAADGNDACFGGYSWAGSKTVLPEGTYSVVVDSANAGGGNYNLYMSREHIQNDSCAEAVDIQMGGKWYGNTIGYAQYGCAFCTANATSGSGGACSNYTCNQNYRQSEFELNHTVAPWQRNMGYVIQAVGVSGFDPAISVFKHSCFSNLNTNVGQVYGVECSNNMDDTPTARVVTGVIPSNYVAEVRLNGYSDGSGGNYELTVQYDTDGDGLVDTLDSWPASLWGSTPNVAGGSQNGPIPIGVVPYSDTRSSWGYPNDYREVCTLWFLGCLAYAGRGGEEVYYKMNVGGNVRIRVGPGARGDVWSNPNLPNGWDPVLWYSNDCASWSYRDAGGVNESEEVAGVNGNGCIAVDGYVNGDGGYYLLEVTR